MTSSCCSGLSCVAYGTIKCLGKWTVEGIRLFLSSWVDDESTTPLYGSDGEG